jgi:hypothetical protein
MLDDRTRSSIAETLALQRELIDYGFERGREHVLVREVGVRTVGTGEGNARTAHDGDAANLGTDKHVRLRNPAAIFATGPGLAGASTHVECHRITAPAIL